MTRIRLCPSGIHLFDRNSGWNVLIDQLAVPQRLCATAPRQVSIALTNSCDLSCSYCYAPKARATLEYDSVIAWLRELDAHGALGIGFGGGEPTLHPRFSDLCLYGARKTRLAITFTTHGHHLDDALLERLQGDVHFIRISMDGINATYERLRRRSFDKLLQRLSAVRGIGRFGINYVVNADTFPDINQAAVLAEQVGASELLLLPERRVHGRPGVSQEVMRDLIDWVMKFTGAIPLSVSAEASDGLPVCRPFAQETALSEYAHVSADGTLKATSFDTEGVIIGPLGIMDALNRLSRETVHL
jgi:MoaA/NifB/PqqE/SkfB family radical SAM enzyme